MDQIQNENIELIDIVYNWFKDKYKIRLNRHVYYGIIAPSNESPIIVVHGFEPNCLVLYDGFAERERVSVFDLEFKSKVESHLKLKCKRKR